MSDTGIESWEDTRPGWPKVVGILSLVFGILGVTCGVAGVAMMPLMSGFMEGAMSANAGDTPPPPLMPEVTAVGYVSYGFGVLVNVLLIAAGAALLGRKPAGRTLHLAYGLLGVLAAFAGIFVQWQMQNEQAARMEAWLAEYGSTEFGQQMQAQQAMSGVSNMIGLAIGMVIALAWPLFCMIWFGVVKTRPEQMTGERAGAESA